MQDKDSNDETPLSDFAGAKPSLVKKIIVYGVLSVIFIILAVFCRSFFYFILIGETISPGVIISETSSYLLSLLLILYAIWLVWGVTPFSKKDLQLKKSNTHNLIEKHITDIFESNEFRQGLKNSLPQFDSNDEKIWEMLSSMIVIANQKHENFIREYRKYFRWTVCIGVTLVTLFLSMSYYFLNEASTGAEKSVYELEKRSNEIEITLKSVQNETINEAIEQSLTTLSINSSNNEENRIINEIRSSSYKINNSSFQDLVVFAKVFSEKVASLKDSDVSNSFKSRLSDASHDINNLINSRERIFNTLPTTIEQLNASIKKADETLDKPENRIPEVIKRLFITIGVITFFLAILKYCARLYRENFIQAAIAEQDHFLLKKFFMSYNLANPDDKNKILTTFLSTSNQSATSNTPEEKDEDSNKLMDLMKEFLTVLKGK